MALQLYGFVTVQEGGPHLEGSGGLISGKQCGKVGTKASKLLIPRSPSATPSSPPPTSSASFQELEAVAELTDAGTCHPPLGPHGPLFPGLCAPWPPELGILSSAALTKVGKQPQKHKRQGDVTDVGVILFRRPTFLYLLRPQR